MRTVPLFPRQPNSPKRNGEDERVTGRKARGLQTEEIGCKCQTFLSLLSGRKETNQRYVFPSLYKFKRFLLKCCAAMSPGLT